MKYPYLRPILPQPETWVPLLETSYAQRYFSNYGPLATRLEGRMTENYLIDGYSSTLVTSNTLGIQAVLNALEVYDRYVILPDFTFSGTLQAVIAAGGKPIVCDVLKETSELDPKSVKAALEKYDDVAAIMHVRCYGFVNDVTPLKKICKAHDIPLVIDAAAALSKPDEQTFGSEYGEIEIFSLHATKVFAIGEGGLIAAPDHISERIRRSVNFGFQSDRTFHDGTNAKMDEFRAAIGFGTLDLIDGIVDNRQKHAALYLELFEGNDFVELFEMPELASWSCFPILVPESNREKCITVFADQGVEVKKYYWPSLSAGYQGRAKLEIMPVDTSLSLQNSVMCLPIYSESPDDFWPGLSQAVRKSLQLLDTTR